ncbi:hypothetical protein NW768_006809 [Fusarium equiseti]|uniref:Uncharacterized protein n=1 Tax=Fusarium equiseti TaxID=61235 RepID=A0ABQ8R9C9_FUSEQ|nr:hypothetical protein NW768_006809 [Fusarium equiseti]
MSAQGLDLSGGSKAREQEAQKSFKARMTKRYCPEPPSEKPLWCPSARFMEDIFGPGPSKDLFSPRDGLFLCAKVELLLEEGIIAIVPDVEHEPADPEHSLNDQDKRRARLRE